MGKEMVGGDWREAFAGLADKLKTDVAHAGAQAMAQTVYDEAVRLAPVSEKAHVFHGTNRKYRFEAGTLRASLYQVFSKDRSTDDAKVYHVAWNHKKAPYGFMVEFGTSRAPAHPFLYPAYALTKSRLVDAAMQAMREKINGP